MNTIQLKDFLLAENTLDGKEYAFISQNDKTRKINLDSLKEFIVGTGTLLTSDQSSIINAINEIQQTILNQSGGAGVLQTEIDKIKEDYVSKTNDLLENYSVGASTPTLIPTVQALTDVYDLLNGLITTINKNIGDKSKLTTTDVSTLVNAINEINNSLENISLKAQELEGLIGGNFDVSTEGSLVDKITNLKTTIDTNKPIWDDKYTKAEIDNKVSTLNTSISGKSDLNHTHTKSDITDFPKLPTKLSELTNDAGYITSADVDTSQNHTHSNKTILDGITSAEVTKWNTVSNKADKTHTHKISDITDMPTKLSQFTNDAGYITKSDTSISTFNVASEYSPNIYKITTGQSLTSLKDGYSVRVAIPTDASGAVSVMVDGITVPVTLSDGSAITDFKAGGVYNLTYYNGNFICASGGKSLDTVTFTSDKLLTGYTANDSDVKAIEGTMVNNGAPTSTLSCGGSYMLSEGYYSGGTITANSLASQTQATATASQILSGQTAYVNGNKITGNMPNLSASSTIEFGVGNTTKVIKADELFRNKNTDGVERICFRYSGDNGYITGNTLFGLPITRVASQLGLTADKIVAGNDICGVTGTAGGKQFYYLKSTYAENSSITLPFNAEVITITIEDMLYVWKRGVALSADVRFHKVNASGGTAYHTYQYTTTNIVKINSTLAKTYTYEIFAYSV